MRFAEIDYLWYLLILPVALLVIWLAAFRRRQLLRRYADPQLLGVMARPGGTGRRAAKAALQLLALTLVIVALARPQHGHEETTIKARGVDFYVCLDVSRSMMAPADDQASPSSRSGPTRLDRAKQMLGSLIRRLGGDRVGVIPFAGEAFVYCPLTLDHAIALDFLGEISVDTVGAQGTDLGNALDVALDAFKLVENDAGRAIVLLTDGEDQGGRAISAAERAAASGAAVFALGIGSEEPKPILMESGKFLRDRDGAVVESKLNMEQLDQIAAIAKGQAYRATGAGEAQIEGVYQNLRRLKLAPREEKEFQVEREWFPWVLLAALVLLGLEWIIPERGPEPANARRSQGKFVHE
jgi:Ca-activated chloride channel family protein